MRSVATVRPLSRRVMRRSVLVPALVVMVESEMSALYGETGTGRLLRPETGGRPALDQD